MSTITEPLPKPEVKLTEETINPFMNEIVLNHEHMYEAKTLESALKRCYDRKELLAKGDDHRLCFGRRYIKYRESLTSNLPIVCEAWRKMGNNFRYAEKSSPILGYYNLQYALLCHLKANPNFRMHPEQKQPFEDLIVSVDRESNFFAPIEQMQKMGMIRYRVAVYFHRQRDMDRALEEWRRAAQLRKQRLAALEQMDSAQNEQLLAAAQAVVNICTDTKALFPGKSPEICGISEGRYGEVVNRYGSAVHGAPELKW